MSQFNVQQVFHAIINVSHALQAFNLHQKHIAGAKNFKMRFKLNFTKIIFFFSFLRFDSDYIPDKYGDKDIENEIYVNKNILRPTRSTRDRIELLSNLKYREQPKRYSGKCQI